MRRRDFIKKSVFVLAGLSLIPGFGLAENNNVEPFPSAAPDSLENDELKTVAFICKKKIKRQSSCPVLLFELD